NPVAPKPKRSKNRRKNNTETDPPKTENILAKWIRNVIKKAGDERRFEEGRKKKDKKQKK
ncbi:MAG: hypothetical protein LBL39_00720, partial [Planctomycetaceae bacterium]|nr:hypothetical protein [Planctomycetaceae bacterium]